MAIPQLLLRSFDIQMYLDEETRRRGGIVSNAKDSSGSKLVEQQQQRWCTYPCIPQVTPSYNT